MAEPVFKTGVAAPAVDLRVTCKARANRVAQIVVVVLFAELADELGTLRPWTDEAHIATQHVPQLWQFIKAETAQVLSGACAARISGYGPDRTQVAFGVLLHGSKFDDGERSAIQPDADLPIQNRSAIGHTNGERNDRQQRRENNQRRRGNHDIHRAFDDSR